MKKLFRIILLFTGGILTLAILLFILLLIQSPGKPRPFMNEKGQQEQGSITEIKTLNINGLDQRMIIRGRDTTKPVLLYLHGGPGSPEFPFVRQFNSGIEDIFVVCYWDQRGAGLSYSKDIPPSTMTLPQFVEDTKVVSEYLIRRFSRDKIYLLGHSWGTLLGSFTVKKYPEYYHAFISVGQVAQQEKSEVISYNFVLSKAKELKDGKAIKSLEGIGLPPYSGNDESVPGMEGQLKMVIFILKH
jgi:pimeloyl-ACP methyl ester carboxylesterase